MSNNFFSLFSAKKPIIGMIHLLTMPGGKGYPGYQKLLEHALTELKNLEAGGIDGVLVENDNDVPYTLIAGSATVATMTAICAEVVKQAKVPVGVEVLLNDPKASLSIALASGAQFIRTDYFVDKMSRPEYGGEIYINAEEVIKFRSKIKADHIYILADIQVKHATLLEKNKPISLSVKQAIKAGADGIIVTGDLTGHEPLVDDLKEAMQVVKKIPVLIGSGFARENAKKLLSHANGVIVGSSIKEGGKISVKKTKNLMEAVRNAR